MYILVIFTYPTNYMSAHTSGNAKNVLWVLGVTVFFALNPVFTTTPILPAIDVVWSVGFVLFSRHISYSAVPFFSFGLLPYIFLFSDQAGTETFQSHT